MRVLIEKRGKKGRRSFGGNVGSNYKIEKTRERERERKKGRICYIFFFFYLIVYLWAVYFTCFFVVLFLLNANCKRE